MKKKWLKRILSGVLAAILIAVAVPVSAIGTKQSGQSPLAEFFDESKLNPAYKEWIGNGGQGVMPAAQDFSYLTKSYARLRSMQNNALLPEKYDLREKGRVEPVLNQDVLGICWAVVANSAAGSPLMEQFPQTSLSPIHTTWFTFRGPEEEEYRFADDPYNAGGGDGIAVGSMAAWKGPVSAKKAPLNPGNQQDPEESLRYAADYHLQDAYYMPYGNYYEMEWETAAGADTIKQILMDTGAVSVHYYSSGENAYNEETSAWYNSGDPDNPVFPDHAVLIVGWDDNYPKENFCEGNQPQNDGAWLVRNSWGTDWGDDGYFWLSYEDKSSQIGSAYLLEDADNYAKNYQYDTMGWSYSLATNEEQTTKATAANIFTVESDEQLEAVSFYTTDAGAKYSISVYTGVKEGKPESGTLRLDAQNGMEPYAGYHTIELNEPIALKAGEHFSIVVTLENPDFEAPLAIEWYLKDSPEDVPAHMGAGGESYVYADDAWRDVAGSLDEYFYVTNVCIKGFTNPLPESGEAVSTVRFSEMEGPVADGTKIELTAEGAEELWYSEDGDNYSVYDDSLKMDFSDGSVSRTIFAYAVKGGKRGNTVQKTYTKASAQLTDLALRYGDVTKHCETDKYQTQTVFLPIAEDCVQIMAQSSDTIYLDGEPLESGQWSGREITLEPGEAKEITVRVEGEGKNSSAYTLKVYRSMLTFNFEAETVSYDDTQYTVKDAGGNPVESGDSISDLISTESETELTVTPIIGGDSFPDYIPKRPVLSDVEIDYQAEQTWAIFRPIYMYSSNPDMTDAVRVEVAQQIPVTPGEDLYIQRLATDTDFAGPIYHLEVPGRPSAPEAEAAEITETSVTLQEVNGALYSNGGDEWQDTPVFTDLTPGKEYEFQVYLPATQDAFRSEIGTAKITTAIPAVNPSDYSFEVKYVDGGGNPVPGGGKIVFDKTGPYSREDIPLPVGYVELIPASPDEDWLYPTALELIEGQWTVVNPVVEIMVEPMASVQIIFKDADGNILEDSCYTKYYDSEGGGVETVTVPEGYEFIGNNTFAVDITRSDDGKLIADPSEVVFVVKAVSSDKPGTPETPSEPDNGDIESPDTGDNSDIYLWFVLAFVSGSFLAGITFYSKKKKIGVD